MPKVALNKYYNWMFTISNLGVARDIIGGVLVTLLGLKFFDYPGSTVNINDRFKRAHGHSLVVAQSPFPRSWPPHCQQSILQFENTCISTLGMVEGIGPMLLLEGLVFTLRWNILSPQVHGHTVLLKEMLQVCESGFDIKMIHSHGL